MCSDLSGIVGSPWRDDPTPLRHYGNDGAEDLNLGASRYHPGRPGTEYRAPIFAGKSPALPSNLDTAILAWGGAHAV